MNKRFLLTGLLGCTILSAIAQQSPVLLSFSNGKKVTKSEFEYVYQRNNGGLDSAKKHGPAKYKEYLDLYIRYRRKVMDAEAAGLDTLQSFKDELNGYIKQLSQPYLIEKEVLDELIKEAYERSKSEIHAAHLLVNCAQDAKPEDTLAAYTKAIAFRDSIVKSGKPFAYMAEKYSDDPSARQNKGDLGYFTVFDFVYPFESGAYKTPVGQVSMPIRSQFGYHLIYVMDKVPAQGTKRVSHIMVRIGENYSAKDTTSAIARINEIYEKLKGGADFAKLAETMSDDPISAKKGGDLGSGFLLYELQMQKHALSVGQFSRPFTSPYGWHILKVTEVNPVKPFEQAKNELKQKV
ncbi:MAG: peptidylprolyl isomerase, partial [Bacteroidia bacterium]|nr:peptidylprolyl isomerase [Bacteroidia bacterium]